MTEPIEPKPSEEKAKEETTGEAPKKPTPQEIIDNAIEKAKLGETVELFKQGDNTAKVLAIVDQITCRHIDGLTKDVKQLSEGMNLIITSLVNVGILQPPEPQKEVGKIVLPN